MRRFLLFLSSLFVYTAFCQTTDNNHIDIYQTQSLDKYAISVNIDNSTISGILVTRCLTDTIMGSIVNDFGISAIDFVYKPSTDDMKLTHIISFINKWYIKKVLASDLKFGIHILYDIPYIKKHKYVVEQTNDTTTITNTQRHITYHYSPIKYRQDYETGE